MTSAGHREQAGRAAQAGTGGRAAQLEQAGQTGLAGQAEHAGHGGHAGLAGQTGLAGQAEHAGLVEQAGLAELEEAAAEAVREASRQQRLASLEDVLVRLNALGFQTSLARLAEILSTHPGIGSFESLSGHTAYHAPDLLSRTYALILDRKGSPVELMAGEIRANSRNYPRPVPVGLFEAPPFSLAPHEIEHALKTMAASPDFQDITFTIPASGVAYLFSTAHLERRYAEFLAERAESMAMNP